ncbi:thiamine-phosphate kinase [Aliidiomarina shirensis]|uniref:Thiamine-monophosphate kinase n=1 Tax=Aliidiomarina shirensis TaxID=1048642 RepID=A0A432WQT1_9GAMM|nr:thiamine-phosphate kinase [Aliidiomarina shirensis]RUO36134.1 thiamine-phosphate kinase [Aliidiomarina shirensis]
MNIQPDEFSLIAKYFQRSKGAGNDTGSAVSATSQSRSRRDVAVGIGDDAAVVIPPSDCGIAITTDTMVSGVHFDDKVPVAAIGHKLVAVNLSDLAAMGAEPAWLSLSCAFPAIDEAWLAEFSRGFFAAADYYRCALIGGDVTKGPLTLTLTAQGIVPADRYLQRSGAQPGDRIYVSGTLGDAALALAGQQGRVNVPEQWLPELEKRLFYPTPRVGLGQLLRNQATSAIDLSDGLLGDLKHILTASKVGARIQLDALPYSKAFAGSISGPEGWRYQLAGGDDYELCFTIPESRCGGLETLALQAGVKVTCVGIIDGSREMRFFEKNQPRDINLDGYSHFASRD